MADKEYIEREAAISVACKGCNKEFPNEPCEPSECYIQQGLFAIPAADVVEVVRCKDCEYWGGVTFGYICRRFSGTTLGTTLRNETRESDYCSFGTKMDGKGESE